MTDAREIARGLNPEQRALLYAWGHPRGMRSRLDQYPRTVPDEFRVMGELKVNGLFDIEREDDPELGPLERYFVTDLGRAVARELERMEKDND
jgi:hypothetical protein